MLTLEWFDFVGFLGVLMVLAAYAGMQLRRLRGDGELYSLINFFGAGGILMPVLYAEQMNWSVLFIEVAWMVISLFGLFLAVRQRMGGWRGKAEG